MFNKQIFTNKDFFNLINNFKKKNLFILKLLNKIQNKIILICQEITLILIWILYLILYSFFIKYIIYSLTDKIIKTLNIYIKIYFIIKIKFIKIKNYLITNFYFLTNLNYYKLKFINKKNKKLKITRKELIQNIKVFVQQIQNFKNIQNIIIQPLYNYIKNKKIISKFYIRKSKFFNKTKYSFIRQECKNIVHFSLILNVLLVLITFHVCLHWNFTTNYPILFLFLILIFNINIIFKIKQIWFFFLLWTLQ